MRRIDECQVVPDWARPSSKRAAAAARLAGAADSQEAVAARMRQAARRSRAVAGPAARPPRPATPVAGPAAPGASPTGGRYAWPDADPDRTVPIPLVTMGAAAARLARSAGHPAQAASSPAAGGLRPDPTERRMDLTASTAGAAALAVVPEPSETGGPARPRHLKVVPEPGLSPAQRRRRARAALFAGIAGATLVGLALVYFHVVLAQRQFAVDRLDTQLQQAQTAYQQKRLEVAQLGSPAHIISMAEGQLGMVQPTKVTYLTAPAGTVPGGTSASSGDANAAGDQASRTTATTAPAGDADWPQIKSELAGLP